VVQRSRLIKEEIVEDVDLSEKIDEIDKKIMKMYVPKLFGGSKGAEVRAVLNFEEISRLINQHLNANSTNMTVLQYYHSISMLKKKK
jgi:hypothetical protein